MALSAHFREDPLTHIVSITIGVGDQQFLYSDAAGMFSSRDGFEWRPLDHAVPATAMTYGNGVWIAADGTSMWRSTDSAATWEAISGPALDQLAYIRPDPDQPGVFAGTSYDDLGVIHASFDLGDTWSKVYTAPGAGGDFSVFFNPGVFSGCGGKFFLATQEVEYEGHQGDGYAHVSTDGLSWSRISVFPGGTDQIDGGIIGDSQTRRLTDSITFDEQAERYYAIGWEAFSHIDDTRTNMLYATSSDGLSFGGEGVIATAYSQSIISFRTVLQPAAVSSAGGLNTFATAFTYIDISEEMISTVQATVGPGADNLFPVSPLGGAARNVRFCNGAFVCTAFNAAAAGGTFTSTGGGWTLTHSGSPLFGLQAGLAVGRVAQSGAR